MNKFIKYICLGALALNFSACDSWLDVNPSDKYSADTFWKTKEHATAGIMGCYNALYPWRKVHTMEFEMMTSNCIPYNETNGTLAISQGVHQPTNFIIAYFWSNCYTGIGRTNILLDNIGNVNMDAKEKEQIAGEGKFLRAFYYMNLVDKFGGVPLILESPNAQKHATLPRNSKEECVNQILKDLEEASAVLPEKYDNNKQGRVTKGAALALKARALLYYSKWSEAAQAAKQVIDGGQYRLFDDYRHFFSEANKHNCEVIFNIESKLPEAPNCYDPDLWRLNRPAPLKELVDMYLMTDGKTIEESPLYDAEKPFDNRDPRLLKSIVCVGHKYLGKTITKSDVPTTGFGIKKYTSYEDDESRPLVEMAAYNFILIRYAEVLLTYAEAQNEAVGPDQSVYDAINQLRRRPDIQMPDVPQGLSQDEMREVIRRERRVELAFEGLYYSDVLRWKTIEKENNGYVHNYLDEEIDKRSFNPDRDYLWPIPYNETVLNPNLEQNPLWK